MIITRLIQLLWIRLVSLSFFLPPIDEEINHLIISQSYDVLFSSSVWGPTCDALDQVCKNVMLPDLEVNDVLMFENMGAYTIPIASPFNGFPLPKVEYYIERKQL